MKHLMKRIDKAMDDYSIKKKFLILYILGVIFPIILTDSVVIYTVLHSAEASRLHEMEKAANGFQYSFYNTVLYVSGWASVLISSRLTYT